MPVSMGWCTDMQTYVTDKAALQTLKFSYNIFYFYTIRGCLGLFMLLFPDFRRERCIKKMFLLLFEALKAWCCWKCQSKVLRLLFRVVRVWCSALFLLLLLLLCLYSDHTKSLALNSVPAGWSGWRSSSRARGSVCTPTCWRASACGTLRRVSASRGPVTTSGGSCLIPTHRASTTTMPPPSAQCGTGPRPATSSPWPSCRLWSSTPMPTPVLQVEEVEEEEERRLTTARDVTAVSAEREAPPPPWTRSSLINRATERKQTGKNTWQGRGNPPSRQNQVIILQVWSLKY